MNKPLSYVDLFSISEELSQLAGFTLQNLVCESPECYFLGFYGRGESRQVIIDLSPTRPFIVSTNSAIPKKNKKPTPTLNFLKAHFKGLRWKRIEIAQKPNRTLRIFFSGSEAEIFLE